MNKQTELYPHNEPHVVLSNKKKETVTSDTGNNTDESKTLC